MKIIVAGSRTLNDYESVKSTLDRLTRKLDKKKLIVAHGGALGADRLARRWCEENYVTQHVYHPDYTKHAKIPKYAPLARNQEMIESGATVLICFWDKKSAGTKDIISRARKKGLKVKIYKFGEDNK